MDAVLNYLTGLISRMGHWGYLVLFVGAALESAAFLGLVIPGESLVLVAGFFAAQGLFDLDVTIMIAAIGAALGDSIGYEMGRKLGRPALLRYGSRLGLSQERVDKAERFFTKHGGKAVFLGRFVGFARALVPFLAGSSEMRYRQFMVFNVLGAALWAAAITLLGYFLGASWGVAEKWIGRAGAVISAIVLFVFLIHVLWRWLVHHEAWVKQCWGGFINRPNVVRLRHRHAREIAFVQARLSPESYLGLRLTLGVLLLLGAAWLFGGIAEDVVTGDPLTYVDVQIADWLHVHTVPWLTSLMIVITDLHGTFAMSAWIALGALILAWRRNWRWLLSFMLTVPLGMLVNVAMKHVFQRARPQFEHPLIMLTSYSFPSGHTAASTLFYGFFAALFTAYSRSWSHRVWIILSAFTLVVLVAFSRMYLGAHYLSDVLAAMAEGVAWLALCLTGVHAYGEYQRNQQAP